MSRLELAFINTHADLDIHLNRYISNLTGFDQEIKNLTTTLYKVLLSSFHFNAHTLELHPQTQKFRIGNPLTTKVISFGSPNNNSPGSFIEKICQRVIRILHL